MDQYLGEICAFGFNFAPYQWALCQGQILQISSNAALFSLLGTYYGGNGTSTFGLPNLQGRAALHAAGGPGPGLSTFQMGQTGGNEKVTLLVSNMPGHTHGVGIQLNANNGGGTAANPGNCYPAGTSDGSNNYSNTSNATMAAGSLTGATMAQMGSGTAMSIMRPYLAINYSIALTGYFPTRQ